MTALLVFVVAFSGSLVRVWACAVPAIPQCTCCQERAGGSGTPTRPGVSSHQECGIPELPACCAVDSGEPEEPLAVLPDPGSTGIELPAWRGVLRELPLPSPLGSVTAGPAGAHFTGPPAHNPEVLLGPGLRSLAPPAD